MRIPHIINLPTFTTYKPSPESLDLEGEKGRRIRIEDFEWDAKEVPTLVDLSLKVIAENFENNLILNEVSCEDRDHLLETISLEIPVERLVETIKDDYYWERRYKAHYPTITRPKPPGWTWKVLYIERYVRDVLEKARTEYGEEEELDSLLKMCRPYVKRLVLKQLLPWEPPKSMDPHEVPTIYPNDHINFEPVCKVLDLIEVLEIRFGVNNVGQDFTWRMFELSIEDCYRLAGALNNLKQLRVLRLEQSAIRDKHAQVLCYGLLGNETLTELSLAHCEIGDHGAKCIATLMIVHPKLELLNLSNNFIGHEGGEAIGYALTKCEGCLTQLNLRLNPLKHEGTMGILRGLVRERRIRWISLAACQFEEETSLRFAGMLKLNNSLEYIDVSSNFFPISAAMILSECVGSNRSLKWMNLKQTKIPEYICTMIQDTLTKNRIREYKLEEHASRYKEEEVQVIDESESEVLSY